VVDVQRRDHVPAGMDSRLGFLFQYGVI
jgi:hypothetical protein